MFGLVLTATVAARAAERESDGDPQWPNVALDEPQWPNLRLDDIDAPRPNRRPAFVDPQEVEDRIMGRKRSPLPKPGAASKAAPEPNLAPAADGLDANASVAARWPTLPPEKQRSPFLFEAGARYWYSTGDMKFGFANGNPFFGDPTSTLDWRGLTAHSGEVFARVDHVPSGVFVKGVVSGGAVRDGHIDDKDFLVTQYKFSDTTSDVSSGNLSFAMFDVGWAYSPLANLRLGFFVGYHYWQEKVTANGVVCNMASVLGCPFTNAVPVAFGVPVLSYEPTWHAVRIGADSRFMIDDRWSVSGEIAVVPYAAMENKDSHLLRQSSADLGPAPNIISTSKYAYGVETELFVNYAVTPNIEIGAGVRYWGLASRIGGVRFGPSFAITDQLSNFDQERYGVLLQAKGRF
jgi:outer membrane protease